METIPMSVKTADAREYRRLTAWNMAETGFRQVDIAAALGVTEGAVSQWLKKARRDGVEALKARKLPGARPRLTQEQKDRLVEMLAEGAEAFGFRGDVWTQARVADVIRWCFGVRYHPSHMCRLLRACGWTQQKPRRRASQRDEEAIARWGQETWPALKKSA